MTTEEWKRVTRVNLDTNVLLSALRTDTSAPATRRTRATST